MSKKVPLWKALNLSSLMIGIGAVLAGDASANLHGNAEFFPATMCIAFVMFAQMAGNCYIRYSQSNKRVGENADPQISSIRSLGLDPRSVYLEASRAFLLLAVMAGCMLTMGGWWTILAGAFILIIGWLMVGGAVPVISTPWSSLFTFILFGPVTVIPVCLIQALYEANPDNIMSWFDISPSIFMAVCIGVMAANCNLAYNYVRYPSDLRNSRETFTVTFGRVATRRLYLVNAIVGMTTLGISGFLLQVDHPWVIICHAGVFLLTSIYIVIRMGKLPRNRMEEIVTLSNLNILLMGISALIISLCIGFPDDSHLEIF